MYFKCKDVCLRSTQVKLGPASFSSLVLSPVRSTRVIYLFELMFCLQQHQPPFKENSFFYSINVSLLWNEVRRLEDPLLSFSLIRYTQQMRNPGATREIKFTSLFTSIKGNVSWCFSDDTRGTEVLHLPLLRSTKDKKNLKSKFAAFQN